MIINDTSLIFDIGASIGNSVERFRAAADVRRIVSVEPLWESYVRLRDRKFPKTIPILAAAWSSPGIVEICPSTEDAQLSSVNPQNWIKAYPAIKWGTPQFVPSITLDQLIAKFGSPQLIKIDVEGCEKEVFKGLSVRCPFLIFEFHGKFVQDALDCLAVCQKLGFTKAHYVQEDLDLKTEPTLSIPDFISRWTKAAPPWGNITVS